MVRNYLRGLLRRTRDDRLDGGEIPPAPGADLSGCIASTLFLLAGIFATLAITLAR